MPDPVHTIARIPVIVSVCEESAFTEIYGFTGSQGYEFLEAQRTMPENPQLRHGSDLHVSGTVISPTTGHRL